MFSQAAVILFTWGWGSLSTVETLPDKDPLEGTWDQTGSDIHPLERTWDQTGSEIIHRPGTDI